MYAEVVEYACQLAPDLRGDFIENVSSGMDTYSLRQPLGVRKHCCPVMVGHLCVWVHVCFRDGPPSSCSDSPFLFVEAGIK